MGADGAAPGPPPGAFLSDLTSHQRGPGFLTVVAGTYVLATQIVVLFDYFAIATFLWAVAIVLWVLLTYAIFTALTIKREKPSLAEGVSGGWGPSR